MNGEGFYNMNSIFIVKRSLNNKNKSIHKEIMLKRKLYFLVRDLYDLFMSENKNNFKENLENKFAEPDKSSAFSMPNVSKNKANGIARKFNTPPERLAQGKADAVRVKGADKVQEVEEGRGEKEEPKTKKTKQVAKTKKSAPAKSKKAKTSKKYDWKTCIK